MTSSGPSGSVPDQRRHYPIVEASKIAARPTPDADPRTFELSQLQRRFNLSSTSGTTFTLSLKPSDPDFVYSINVLKLRLIVPASYREPSLPNPPLPSIEVLNPEIPLGYRVNVERGFTELAERRRTATLLQLMNALDRGLEAMLSEEKAVTLKIVPNFSPAVTPPPSSPQTPRPPLVEKKAEVDVRKQIPSPVSAERRAAAKARRDTETRQLEARLKLSDVFSKSADGIEYIVPLESRRKDLLPVPLLPIRSVRLVVPMGYDLQPARIELVGVPDGIKERIQNCFTEFVEENMNVSLTAAVNILAVRLHIWAAEKKEKVPARKKLEKEAEEVATREAEAKAEAEAEATTEEEGLPTAPKDPLTKTHIKVIPRPPEWSFPDGGDDDEDSDDYSDLKDSSGDEHAAEDHTAATADDVPHAAQERGTSLSCPGIQMSGVELLEVLKLNVNIKCTKCKQERETLNLLGTPPGMVGKPQAFRCEKCSEIMGIGFRKDFIHQNSHRLGFFDLDGCTVAEILPSSFTPQCICSTPLPAPGMKDIVRGQSVSANCRECYRKMSLYIPEFKLLRITQNDKLGLQQIPLKAKTDKARYIAGTELPHKGRCKHYRKSTRWFRFSCCSKVFPCDKCHDEAEKHKSEHANRMICGLCSREQNYRPDECRFCGNAFLSKKLSHYWEGGKGTRDKRLMSRNDPRKYKRLGKKPEE
ncbi:hypothetical protein BZA05DRAFT_76839 [Tricharina praecox]|uniref:uncharacterized protein n=1 Tax=Tricharina praecox TaxID=43433 RepID=UPI002220884C|nr:uncharacterized protein BZA05DRAFT_76839 [Tricharina praecox]KAI5849781.1 hypothetical protein BZA05DRAFT_76839 [Tricharina praecox]